ncbi:MAG: DUF4291 domain-containing protein [Chitinophagales bacterium]
MKLITKKYNEQIKIWPNEGFHIMAQYDEKGIVVYQSYRPEIGNFAAKNQYFGGPFSLNRMTWIKPNFLWMMYRNGWGQKEGQEVVLAIHLKREAFERYLKKAVVSSYQNYLTESREDWHKKLKASSVRLQWDPDHNPYGENLKRKAIQIGVRNEEIVSYAKDDILEIEDISKFVKEQHQFVLNKDLENLIIPEEKPLIFKDDALNKRINLTK